MKRTSIIWLEKYNGRILDPDGWDRKNFQKSFYEEKISRNEFEQRLMRSTTLFEGSDYQKVWKDFPYTIIQHFKVLIINRRKNKWMLA